jgi:HSP20 family protein
MRLTIRSHMWRPPTDVYETEQALIVRLEIAGMSEADFSIVLDGRYLMIRGVRSESPERRAYHQMEIPFGEFGVDLDLPFNVVMSAVEAVYSNGFLRIILPKTGPQKIQIEE